MVGANECPEGSGMISASWRWARGLRSLLVPEVVSGDAVVAELTNGKATSNESGEAARLASDEVDLQASLVELAGLVSNRTDMEGLLGQVARFAVHAIPGAYGVGVTLLRAGEEGRIEAIASSSDLVSQIDVLQDDVLNEGPCITAAAERRTVRSGSLGTDPKWPGFGPKVSDAGVHSALSLPILALRSAPLSVNHPASLHGRS